MCPSLRKWELQIWHLVLIWKLIVDEMRTLMIHCFPMIAALKDGTNPVRGRDITPNTSVVLHLFDALSLWNFPIVSSWRCIALMFAAFFYEFEMTQTDDWRKKSPFAESFHDHFLLPDAWEQRQHWWGVDRITMGRMARGPWRWSLRKQCRSGMWALLLRGVGNGGGVPLDWHDCMQ